MSRKVTEAQKKEILALFLSHKKLKEISKIYNFTLPTITRQLKAMIGNDEFLKIKNISEKKAIYSIKELEFNADESNNKNKDKVTSKSSERDMDISSKQIENDNLFFSNSQFVEITPINQEFYSEKRKEISSVPVESADFPEIVYMIVDKKIELETKLLKEYPEWQFLPEEELDRKSIQIYFELKKARSICNKEQKVLKVPNTNIFKLVSSILVSKGITRIVSDDQLISLK